MKKAIIGVIVALMLSCMFASVVCAEVDENGDEVITVKKSDLPKDVLSKVEVQQKVEQYGNYVGLGKEVGTAMNESLKAVTEQTAKFGKTSVGKFIMFVVLWKVIGSQLVRIIFMIPIIMLITVIAIWMSKQHCMSYMQETTRKNSDGTIIETKKTKQFPHDGETGVWVAVIWLTYLLCLGIGLAIMFA